MQQEQSFYNNKNQNRDYKNRNPTVITLPQPPAPTFREAVNAYIPLHKADAKLDEVEIYERSVTNLLNKLTPDNKEKILENARQSIMPKSLEEMEKLSDLIFQKTTNEPHYTDIFIDFYNVFKDANFGEIKLQNILLRRCQTIFETSLESQIEEAKTKLEKRIEDATDENTKIQLRDAEINMLKKIKDSYFHNCKFIARLCARGVANIRIMNLCFDQLLLHTDNDPTKLECLCKLIETSGVEFEKKSKENNNFGTIWNNVFTKIINIQKSSDLDKRTMVILSDLIELRKQKWKNYSSNSTNSNIVSSSNTNQQSQNKDNLDLDIPNLKSSSFFTYWVEDQEINLTTRSELSNSMPEMVELDSLFNESKNLKQDAYNRKFYGQFINLQQYPGMTQLIQQPQMMQQQYQNTNNFPINVNPIFNPSQASYVWTPRFTAQNHSQPVPQQFLQAAQLVPHSTANATTSKRKGLQVINPTTGKILDLNTNINNPEKPINEVNKDDIKIEENTNKIENYHTENTDEPSNRSNYKKTVFILYF
jgi:hypothetical protein